MTIRYRVDLSEAERAQLTTLLNGGKHAARKIKRAQILLAADAGISDEVIASNVSVGTSTVYRTKRRFVEGNLDLALSEEGRPGTSRKLSGKETALLVATACTSPPAGRKRWTLDRKRCSATLGVSALQDGWSGCQFHGISLSMRFCGQPLTRCVSKSAK